jgi:ABC-type Fe3+-siderophore transport system permease subunit
MLVGVLQSFAITILAGLILYGADKGIAYHICLYSAIAYRRKFTAEDAYREMHDPFVTPLKVVLTVSVMALVYVFARYTGIGSSWHAIILFAALISYVCVSVIAVLRAFSRTKFGRELK